MLERDLVAEIKTYLASLGSDVFYFKEHAGPYGQSGIPDIIVCYRGRFLGLEAKLPNGRLTVLQRRAIEKINLAGGIACRVESVDDVKTVIRQADEETLSHANSSGRGANDNDKSTESNEKGGTNMNQLTKPLVFVCSPYRGDVNANVQNARCYCSLAYTRGCIPFAPHLLYPQFLDDHSEAERDAGIAMGIQMLSLCNELWAFGSPTLGMAREIVAARKMGIPVRRFDKDCSAMADQHGLNVADQYDSEVGDHE